MSSTTKDMEHEVGQWIELMGPDLKLKILAERKEAKSCDVGCAVSVSLVGRVDQQDGAVFDEANDLIVVIGDKDVTPALEMGLRFMREGEEGLIFAHSKYGYGPIKRKYGSYELPPHSNIFYRVRVGRVVDDQLGQPSFQMEIARHKKAMGNDRYRNEWSDGQGWSRSLHLYQRAAEAMTHLLPSNEEAREILVDCYNNVAAVHLRNESYGKAKEAAAMVLMHDATNRKGLLRAARAAMLDPAVSFAESDAAMEAAQEAHPDDPDVRKLLAELDQRKRAYKKKSKALFSKMSRGIKPANVQQEEPTITMEPSRFRRYLPYMIQLVMPFVTYGIFLLVKNQSTMATIGESMPMTDIPAVMPDPPSNVEF